MNEAEIGLREEGLSWDVVHKAFCWYQLDSDFIRELVETDTIYKTQLEHELLMDIHGYSVHPSIFYQNMFTYLQIGLEEARDLKYYKNQIYMMYREQQQKEFNSRQVYRITDRMGRTLDSWIA